MLKSIPGVSLIISRTMPLDIDTSYRFDSRQQFCPYARLFAPPQEIGRQIGRRRLP